MDRLDAMQAFTHVAETGSFAKTAGTLHMSRTNVTRLVQQLEAWLRIRLLNRITRRLNLTVDGATYYGRMIHLLAELDDAETSLSSAALAPRGRLRIDVPSSLAQLLLISALPELHAHYPEIQIDLGVSDRLVDLVDENTDYVVHGGELYDQSLVAQRVGDLQLRVYAVPTYLQRADMPGHPRELKDSHQCIIDFLWAHIGKALPYAMHRDEGSLRVTGRHVLAANDGNAYLAARLAGLGILWLPHYMACRPLARGELLPLFKDWSLGPIPLYLALPPSRHVSGELRVFIEWVAELVARHAPPLRPPL